MTQSELAHVTRLWQKRLRLKDWEVKPILRTMEEQGDTLGQIFPDEVKNAILHIREDQEESTVVHELLHLHILPFSDGDESEPNHDARETAINLLADCFVRAYPRRKR